MKTAAVDIGLDSVEADWPITELTKNCEILFKNVICLHKEYVKIRTITGVNNYLTMPASHNFPSVSVAVESPRFPK